MTHTKIQNIQKRHLVKWAGALLLASSLPGMALAQASASRPITLVIGFAAGAGTDTLARALAEKLSTRMGQPVIVENKAGASGMLAVRAVALAPADGHTFLFAPNTVVITPHVLPKSAQMGLDILTDLVPVIQATKSTLVLVTSPAALEVKNVKDLTALARRQPGMSFGTAGVGTPQHIAGELYKRSASIDITHVAYRGTAAALTDLMGGHLKLAISSLGAAKPYIDSGRVVPLSVLEKTRSSLISNVPTMAEQGVNGVELTGWFGLFAPRATSAAVVEKMNKELNAILAMPDIQKKFREQGEEPVGGAAKVLADLVRDDYKFYAKVVKDFDIKSD